MSQSDFVYREIRAGLLAANLPVDYADKCSLIGVSKYNKNKFTGSVANFIANEIATSRRIYGAPK